MSMVSQQQTTEKLPFTDAPPARVKSGSGGWPWALLMLALAGGLGYYAFTLRAEVVGTRARLEGASAALAQEQAAAKDLQAQVQTLDQGRAEQSALLAETVERLNAASAELAAAHTRLDELDAERGEMHEQLAEFKQMTRELARMIDSGRLKVSFRRGRMIVELPAKVLFPSGSAELSDEGTEALTQVAKSLRGFSGRNFIVAGHTDNVPVASGRFANNWELSTARAVTVTGALIRGGLRPEQLVAAGYGEYDPIARNTTEVNKQKNRRIEIILEPRLRQLNVAKLDEKAAAKPVAKTAAKPVVAKAKSK